MIYFIGAGRLLAQADLKFDLRKKALLLGEGGFLFGCSSLEHIYSMKGSVRPCHVGWLVASPKPHQPYLITAVLPTIQRRLPEQRYEAMAIICPWSELPTAND